MNSDDGNDRNDHRCPISPPSQTFEVDSFSKDLEIEEQEVTEEASENEDDKASEPTNEHGHPQEKEQRQQQQCRPDRHPHAFKKRTSHSTQQKQNRQRFILFLLSCLTTFFFVGAALAFGPMQLMLEDNGSFSSKCTVEEQSSGTVCDAQRAMFMRLGLFTSSMQLFAPIIGLAVDRYGPKITAHMQGIWCIIGWFIVITGTSTLTDSLLFVGFAVISINVWMGSQLILQLGMYFSGHSISRVITILNALFDGGAITFLVLWWINKNTGENVSMTLGVYTAIGAVLFTINSYFWSVAVPSQSTSGNDGNHDDAASRPSFRFSHYEDLVSNRNLLEAIQNNISTRLSQRFDVSSRSLDISRHRGRRPSRANIDPDSSRSSSRVHPKLSPSVELEAKKLRELDRKSTTMTAATTEPPVVAHDADRSYMLVAKRSNGAQLLSSPFILLCIFFSMHDGIATWNSITQKDFLLELGDDDSKYLFIFTLLTPVSILGIPFVDYMILNYGWTVSFQVINILAVSFLTVKVVSTNLNVQIIGFVLFSFYRSFLFGISFSFLPSLIAGHVVGRAGGIMIASAGVLGLLLIPLIQLVVGDQSIDFFIPNMIILALCVPTTISICILGRFVRLENDYRLIFGTGEQIVHA